MIRIAVLGEIGSGKSHVAKQFGYPVFNADVEVSDLYKKDKKCYNKLKRNFPNHITSFPIKKNMIINAIVDNKKNLKKIVKIIHPEIRRKMFKFIKKNRNKKFVVLDIPLLLENKINKKNDVLIFVDAPNKLIKRNLKKRRNFNSKITNKLKKFQLPVEFKKKKSNFVIKNNFRNEYIKKNVKNILKKILLNVRNST